jgi:hypothetical protein
MQSWALAIGRHTDESPGTFHISMSQGVRISLLAGSRTAAGSSMVTPAG